MKRTFKTFILTIVMLIVAFGLASCGGTDSPNGEDTVVLTGDEIKYTINHYYENLEDDEYTLGKTETKAALPDAEAITFVKDKKGFTLVDDTREDKNKSCIINLYYERNRCAIFVKTDNYVKGNYSTLSGIYKYGAEIQLPLPPVDTGRVFDGWYIGNEKTSFIYTVTQSNVTIIGKTIGEGEDPGNAGTDGIAYKVNHYKENYDDDNYTLETTDTLYGRVGELTDAYRHYFPYYECQDFSQEIIAGDGSTVINLYYKLPRSKFTITSDDRIISDHCSLTGEYKFGTIITLTAPTLAPGYKFDYWLGRMGKLYPGDTIEIDQWDTTIEAIMTPLQVKYTVNHFKENLDNDNYTIARSIELSGCTGTTTQAYHFDWTGFDVQSFNQEKIVGDGSTVVNIYYKRARYTVTFVADEHITSNHNDLSGEYKYGETITIPTPTIEAGYYFWGWYISTGGVAGSEYTVMDSVTITGKTSQNGKSVYYVHHYKENLDDDKYTWVLHEGYSGVDGTTTNVEPKSYTGFVAQDFDQIVIQEGGKTIDIYYKRVRSTLTITTSEHITNSYSSLNGTYKYGALVTLPTPELEEGYIFDGWYIGSTKLTTNTYTIGETNTIIEGKVIKLSKYTVNHRYENLVDDNYTLTDTDYLYGLKDSLTEALAKTLDGFINPTITQKTILEDGSTVIDIYYERITSTITVSGDDNILSDHSSLSGTFKYGTEITLPTPEVKTGHKFIGWYADDELITTAKYTVGVSSVNVVAKTTGADNIKYTVKHYFENVEDSNYTLGTSETLYGTTGAKTAAKAKDITGYFEPDFDQVTIKADGSTVVEIHYRRIRYTIFYEGDDYVLDDVSQLDRTYKYETQVTLTTPKVETGYKFVGWFVGDVMITTAKYTVTASVTLVAKTAYATDIKYKVIHNFENVTDSEYTASTPETFYGTTNSETDAKAKDITGFVALSFTQGTIKADGTTVINIYYKRVTSTITFEADTNITSDHSSLNGTYKYGTQITLPTPNAKTGYGFDAWYINDVKITTAKYTVTESNATLVAKSTEASVRYTVVHYYENLDDDVYEKASDEELSGKTNSLTNAAAKSETGFVAESFTQATIKADGTTIVKIYYKRVTPTIKFEASANITSDYSSLTKAYKYGTEITLPTPEVQSGYVFDGWYIGNEKITTSAYTVTTEAVTIVARTSGEPNILYTVEHYYENVNNDDYTKDSTVDSLYGTTDTTTNAKARSITGFDAQTITQATIKADGTTVVKIYYKRVRVSVIFYVDSNITNSYSSLNGTYKYGTIISIPEPVLEAGYHFSGWKASVEGCISDSSLTVPEVNVHIEGKAIRNAGVSYYIMHYYENANNDNYTHKYDTEGYGVIGTTTNASPLKPTGYIAQDFDQIVLKESDNEIIIYYKRVRTEVTIVLDDHITGTYDYAGTYKYDTFIELAKPTVEVGYEFDGWYVGDKKIGYGYYVPATDVTITAKSKAKTDVYYKIEYWYENLSTDEYVYTKSYSGFGTTGELTDVTAEELTVYVLKPITQQVIKGDGTTVVKVYYSRKRVTIKFEVDDYIVGSYSSLDGEYKCDASITLPTPTAKDGYFFDGWYVGTEKITTTKYTIPSENTTIVAKTVSSTAYTVKHYYENANNSEYTLMDTETLYGRDGTETNAVAKTVTGFTADSFSQATIKADGTTVVNIYYSRQEYSVSISINISGSATYTNISGDYKYESTVTLPNVTAHLGFTFDGWYISNAKYTKSTIEVSGNISVELRLAQKDDVKYFDITSTQTTCVITGVKADYQQRTSFVVPDYVTSIGLGAFKQCTSVESITVPFVGDGNTHTHFGYIFGASTASNNDTSTPSSLKSIVITKGTSVSAYAFKYLNVTSITLPSSVTSIGESAFYSCSSLKSITIPSGVTSIPETLFQKCSSLETVILPSNINSIGMQAFSGCSSLTSLTLPKSLDKIDQYAFYECDATCAVKYEGTLLDWLQVELGSSYSNPMCIASSFNIKNSSGSYYDLKSATSIVIPDTVTNVKQYSLAYMTALTSITLPFTGESVGSEISTKFTYIFGASNVPNTLTDIVLTKGTTIPDNAFYGCTRVTSITFPSGITSIGKSAFSNCKSLTSFTIPSGITRIEKYTFQYCTGMTSITIPTTVTYVCEAAFGSCSKLEVNYSGTLANWCGITFEEDANPTIVASKVYVNNNSSKIDLLSINSLTIPSTATKVGNYAFVNCQKVTSITVSNGVKTIGAHAFEGCRTETATVADSVTSIGLGAFTNYAMKKMVLPFAGESLTTNTHFLWIFGSTDVENPSGMPAYLTVVELTNVTTIPSKSFMNCKFLTTLILPTTVTSIASDAFTNSTKLSIYYKGSISEQSKFSDAPVTVYYYAASKPSTNLKKQWYYDSNGAVQTWSA